MRKIVIILPLLIFATLILAGVASAACTFHNPVSGGTVNGTYVFNVTCGTSEGGSWNVTMVNCTVNASTSRGIDSISFNIFNSTAGTGNWSYGPNMTNGYWNNAEDWVLYGTCYNSTTDQNAVNSLAITQITGVKVDNSDPSVTNVLAIGEIDDTSYTINATVANATSYQCYSGNVVTDTGTMTYSFTGSEVSCRIDIGIGNISYNITAYDGITYNGSGNWYQGISGGVYNPSTGGLVTPGEDALTQTGVQDGEQVPAGQQLASIWQRFVAWLKSLFKIG